MNNISLLDSPAVLKTKKNIWKKEKKKSEIEEIDFNFIKIHDTNSTKVYCHYRKCKQPM